MRTNASSLLNPIKMSHSNSFILSGGEYTGNFNKNNEKIQMLQFDLETTKDTIIKLKAELLNKNKVLSNLKLNNDDKNLEHLYTLKLIATVLKLVDKEAVNTEAKNGNENSNKRIKNNINRANNDNDENANNINNNRNKNYINEEKENNISINSNINNKKISPILNSSEQSFSKGNNKAYKEIPYINSLKLQINCLKELLNKKKEEINEIKKNKTTLNYSKLQNNFEKNIAELTNIKKQNELMKAKIEDVTNLLFIEKEGNKNLKSKLLVFQSSFKEFQENSEKKNMNLEAKLIQAQEKERDCRIFHVRRTSGPELMGSRNSSRMNLINEINDNERLKIAEEEIKNIKKDIEDANKNINSKKEEKEALKQSKNELENKVNELKERNNKLKIEIMNLNEKVKELKSIKNHLEKGNKNYKNQLKISNNNLTNEENKANKIKENLNKKEKEIIVLKNHIEKLKQNNNFKDGMFFTSIGAKSNSKDEKEDDIDSNIDKELAQIEQKYRKIKEKIPLIEEEKKEVDLNDKKGKENEENA